MPRQPYSDTTKPDYLAPILLPGTQTQLHPPSVEMDFLQRQMVISPCLKTLRLLNNAAMLMASQKTTSLLLTSTCKHSHSLGWPVLESVTMTLGFKPSDGFRNPQFVALMSSCLCCLTVHIRRYC
jgi:hypothetical protein